MLDVVAGVVEGVKEVVVVVKVTCGDCKFGWVWLWSKLSMKFE